MAMAKAKANEGHHCRDSMPPYLGKYLSIFDSVNNF